MKKALLLGIVLLISMGLIGCTKEKNQSNKENSLSEGNVVNNDDETSHNGTDSSDSNITSEDFLQSIKQLKPDLQISDSLADEIKLQRLKINQGFYIVWTEHSIPNTELPLLVVFNADREPIYAESFSERIESIKYIGEYVFDKAVIEVTSYGASGSFSGQWVNLLMLNNDSVNEIWEYQTISNDSHLSDEEGVMEYLHDYSTYLVIPSYQQGSSNEGKTKIIVNNTTEKTLVDKEDKVVSKSKDTNELSFIWDEELQKFVKTDSGYTKTVLYENTEYGFTFWLPKSWEGYKIVSNSWEGNLIINRISSEETVNGPMVTIRHPDWTKENPRQDIPIMIFTKEKWNELQQDEFHIGAAPVKPVELGQNNKYVFALPARFNHVTLEGYQEVNKILENEPLQPKND